MFTRVFTKFTRSGPTQKPDVPSIHGPQPSPRVWTATKDKVKQATQKPTPRERSGVGAIPAQVSNFQRFANEIGIRLQISGVNDWKTQRAVRMFQDSFSLGEYWDNGLTVDGDPGDLTTRAVEFCRASGLKASANFLYREFRTNGPQEVTSDNEVVLVTRAALHALERLRLILIKAGKTTEEAGLVLTSAYRSKPWNRHIGGALFSRHMKGEAFDFDRRYMITEQECVQAGFTAFGFLSRAVRIVLHADTRKITIRNFVRWFYT